MKKIMPFVLGGFLLLGAAACTENPDPNVANDGNDVRSDQLESDARARAQRDSMSPDTATNVTPEDISANLADYLGESVSVRQEVEEVAGNYAFLLGTDPLFGGKRVLVINASGQTVDLIEGEGTDVQVTGEVREFVLADIESEYGFDLDSNVFADYENQPVIVAQSIALSPDPSVISDNPAAYYNRRLAIEGNISTMIDGNTMTINDSVLFGGNDLLAISPDETITVEKGGDVVITGVLRPYVYADIAEEYNLTWDLNFQEQIQAEHQNKPVFIIDSIYSLRNAIR